MDSVFVISLRSRMKINTDLFCILLVYSYSDFRRRYFRSRMKININLFCILLAYSYLCNDYLVCCNNFNYYEETTINNYDGPDVRRNDDDGRAC